MAMCSIPELVPTTLNLYSFNISRLMPNKYRHIGIVLSDAFVFFIVVVGPVVGRYAIDSGNDWRYIYYGGKSRFVLFALSTDILQDSLRRHSPSSLWLFYTILLNTRKAFHGERDWLGWIMLELY